MRNALTHPYSLLTAIVGIVLLGVLVGQEAAVVGLMILAAAIILGVLQDR